MKVITNDMQETKFSGGIFYVVLHERRGALYSKLVIMVGATGILPSKAGDSLFLFLPN